MNQEESFRSRFDAIQRRVATLIPQRRVVIFSAYPTDAEDLPVDNLDALAATGPCRFVAEVDPFFGSADSRAYESPIVTDPSWADVTRLANDMIWTVDDRHHLYLEGIRPTGSAIDGVPCYRFIMGS
jgi:hypothetical protein